jgi:signal transduction histidine kinase
MDVEQFETIKRYVEFDSESAHHLRRFHPLAEAHFERIVTDFYEAIDRVPAARVVITGGAEQVERLKRTLVHWMGSMISGPYDASYLQARARIGHVHVRIGLRQEFMFSAMNRIRGRLTEVAQSAYADDTTTRVRVLRALDQIIDVELAIMVDTYHETLLQRARASERLAVIGQLAASIGHELRNPLGTMESSLYLLRQRVVKLGLDDPQLEKHHGRIEGQLKLCSKTIDNLLDLARDRPPRRHTLGAAEIVDRAAEQAGLPPGIRLTLAGLEGLTVDADPDDLLHVIVNLLLNAAQAQAGRGEIHITGERWKGGTMLRIEDDGPGVPPELRHRIFDALFTTKARGTGLGLALARRILHAHGGEIDLEAGDRGARFRLWIPDLRTADNESSEAR